MSFKMVHAKKNILSKCFGSAIVRGIYYLLLYNYVDMMLSMNGIVC